MGRWRRYAEGAAPSRQDWFRGPLIPHEAVTRERLEGHAGRIVPESFGEVNHEGLAAHCIASGETRPQTTALLGSPAIDRAALPTVPECNYRWQRFGRRRPHRVRCITLSACPRGHLDLNLGAMALQRAVYRPRNAEHIVLHQVIAEHFEVFLRTVAAAGDGAGLPQFVEFDSVIRVGGRRLPSAGSGSRRCGDAVTRVPELPGGP